jgi:hypothetical protein
MPGGGGDRLRDRARRWPKPVGYWMISVVAQAAFPRLAHWSRWATRLGPRGLAAYVAANTALLFALRTWAIPHLKRQAAARERARTELAQTLGREPTIEEVLDHLGLTRRR